MLNGPFTMPMFRSLTPRKAQPWIYLLFAFLFQLSGGMYAGAMAHTMGDTCMMREDVLMIVLCGVVGVNMPFPFLFRFKFRFTNRTLLTVAAAGIAVCNLLCLTTESVPLLCAISYVAGFLKLCGTFECMSTIQLWMTPKRDFAIFFPLLYCVVLGDMSLSPWLTVHLTYVFQSWHTMHLCMAAVIIVVVELFAPVFVSAFTSDPEAAHYAVLNLRVEIVGQIFYAIFLVYHALMLGAGDTWWVFLSSFANCIVFRVVLSILFEHFWGVEGVYAACAIAPSISVPVGMYYTRSNRWRKSLAKPAREGE